MEKRDTKITFNKSGGTASKGGITNRVTIPTSWIKDMGITQTDRDAVIEYNPDIKVIKISKK